jgi:hypothetical protein
LWLQHLSPLSILALGKYRYCESRRAEAIMSAVGATDWFASTIDRDGDVVLNTYPLEFINEVRWKVGSAAFFGCWIMGELVDECIENYFGETPYSGPLEPVGSMLPFVPGSDIFHWEHSPWLHLQEHECLSNWQIEHSGSVRMTEAVIVSSSFSTATNDEHDCILNGPSQEDNSSSTINRTANLEYWLHSYKPEWPNYAVCLFRSERLVCGILLKEIREGVLLKIGLFARALKWSSPLITTKVDWLVL